MGEMQMESKDILAVLGENPSRRDILAHWNPEDEAFWKKYGERVAKQNLYTSTWALTLAFVAWTMWATIAAQLNQVGFHFTDNEIFTPPPAGPIDAKSSVVFTYSRHMGSEMNVGIIVTWTQPDGTRRTWRHPIPWKREL